jgi:hypothetical protein
MRVAEQLNLMELSDRRQFPASPGCRSASRWPEISLDGSPRFGSLWAFLTPAM